MSRGLSPSPATPSGQPAASGVVFLTAANGATAVLAYALHAVAARWFTPIGYGPFTVAVTLVLWLKILLASVLLPGFRKAVSEEPSRLHAAVRLGWRWYAPVAGGILLLFVASVPWLAQWMGEVSLARLLLFAAIDLPFSALLLFGQALLGGLRQYRLLAATLASYALARSLGAIVLIVLGYGSAAALGGLALGSAVASIVAAAGVASRLRAERPVDYPQLLRRSWAWTVVVVPAAFGWATLASLDLWMVQALAPRAWEAGLYAGAFMVAQVPRLLLQGVSTAIFPRVSGALTSGDSNLARSVTREALRLAVLVLPGAYAIVATNASGILALLLSPDFAAAGPTLQVLFAAASLAALVELLLAIPAAADQPRVRMLVILSLLVVCSVLLGLWVPVWGGMGAASACLATFAAGALVGLKLVHHYTGAVPPLASLARVGLATGGLLAIGLWWPASGLLVVLKVAVLGTVYLGVLAALGEIGPRDLQGLGRALRPTAR